MNGIEIGSGFESAEAGREAGRKKDVEAGRGLHLEVGREAGIEMGTLKGREGHDNPAFVN
jgi:hypothetical protein